MKHNHKIDINSSKCLPSFITSNHRTCNLVEELYFKVICDLGVVIAKNLLQNMKLLQLS